jgi:putative transposase
MVTLTLYGGVGVIGGRSRPVGTELQLCPNPGALEPTVRFKPRRSSPRLSSFSYQGSYVYHLILNTRGGLQSFGDGRLVATCLECLASSASRYGFEVVAYCFMPDHVHVLVAGSHDASLGRFVQHFKQATGHCHPGLWQRSYYDHILRQEEDLEDVARYIWANPVRAGMVEHMLAYPYSGPRETVAAYGDSGPKVEDREDLEDRAKALSLRSPHSRSAGDGASPEGP